MVSDRTSRGTVMTGTNCPGGEELARFAVGDLDGPALVRSARHVEHCPACERALESLETHPDPLVSSLRTPAATGPFAVPPDLLDAARSMLGTAAETEATPRR